MVTAFLLWMALAQLLCTGAVAEKFSRNERFQCRALKKEGFGPAPFPARFARFSVNKKYVVSIYKLTEFMVQ